MEIFKDMKILNSIVLLSHGKVISVYDLSTTNWLHFISRTKELKKNKNGHENYFRLQENEINSINFMSVNKNQIYSILVEYEGNYLMKLVYYSSTSTILQNKQSFNFDNGKHTHSSIV